MHTFSYDGLGRLLRAEVPGKVIHYAHDGRGRRIGRVVSIGGGPATLDKGWIYGDALNPIAQLDSSGTMEAVYLYGTRANVPDAIVTANGTYRVLSDHLGSVRMVIDQAGTVVEEWDYDAYGNVVSSAGSTGLHPFGFAGGITDPDTGMVRFGARDYEPGTGKWTARDPIKFDGGLNLFGYAGNEPVNRVDLDGEGWKLVTIVVLGVVVSVWVWDVFWNEPSNAMDESRRLRPKQASEGTQRDALRHCIWQCRLEAKYGSTVAQSFGDLNEEIFPNPNDMKEMDLDNNYCARGYGRGVPNPSECTAACLGGLGGDLTTVNPPHQGRSRPAGTDWF